MTVHLVLDPAAADRAVADVRAGARLLADDTHDIDHRVRALLDAGWSGNAAEAFTEAWVDWRSAADQVREALEAMAELVAATRRDLVGRDDSSQRGLDALAAHLVGRLG